MKLKIMTFNVQHMRDNNFRTEDRIDMDKFASYIALHGADIVGLNEVRGKGESPRYEDQVNIVGEKAGYPNRYFARAIFVGGANNPYGNAMISKYPFDAVTVAVPDPDDRVPNHFFETRCVLKADYTIEGKKLTVITTHFGLNPSEAQNAVKTVCGIVDACDNPVVLMGDFNLRPESPILDPIRERFEDTEPLLENGSHFTFPSHAPEAKIDYIFVRGVKALSAAINEDIVSDHYSVEAEIEL